MFEWLLDVVAIDEFLELRLDVLKGQTALLDHHITVFYFVLLVIERHVEGKVHLHWVSRL